MKNKFVLKPFNLFSIGAIFCLGTIAYSNSFLCSFHFDDLSCILNNPVIRNVSNWQDIWNYWPCRFITFLSFALNYHFDQYHVFGYHVFSLAVHLLTAVLVWWLTLLTFSTPTMKDEKIARHADLMALMAGLIFVSHPLQTEAVTFIYQRATSMAAMFYVATLCFYIKSRLQVGRAGRSYYIAAVITALLAVFTKENAITLPLMIILYEFIFFLPKADQPQAEKNKKSLNWRGVFPFLFVLGVLLLTMLLTETGKTRLGLRGEPGISPIHYLLTQFRVMISYIRLIFLPIHQNFNYDYPVSKDIFEIPVLTSLLFLITILFFAKRLFLKYRLVSFSIFWFFLTLLPESSILPIQDVIFEHRLYLPMVGVSMFFASGAYYLLGKNTIRGMVIVLTVLIAACSVLTYQRNKVWRDEITFWNDVIQKSPHIIRPWDNRGFTYYNQGDFAKAITDFNKVIELDPNFAKVYYERGLAFFRLNNYAQALSDYNKAIVLDPHCSDAYDYRGVFYAMQDNFTQAMADFARAIEADPANGKTYVNRAAAYYLLKEYDKAWADVHKARELGADVNPQLIDTLKIASDKAE